MASVTKTESGDYVFDDGNSAPKLMPRAGLSDATISRLENMWAQQNAPPVTPFDVSPDRVAAVAQQTGLTQPTPPPVDNGPAPTPGQKVDLSQSPAPPAPAPLLGQGGAPPSTTSTAPAAAGAAKAGATPGLGGAPLGLPPGMPGYGGMAVQTTTQVAPKLSRSDVQGLDRAAEESARAQTRVAEVEAAGRARQAEIVQAENDRAKLQNAAAVEAEQKRQSEIATQMADLQTSMKELSNKQVDPDRRWKAMNGGQRFGTIVSLFLGALGAALTKGPNYALEQYQRLVDHDVDAQKQEIAKAGTVIGLKNNAIAQMMAKGASERQAEAVLRANRVEEMQNAIKAEALRSDSQEVQARGAASVATLAEQHKKDMANLKLATQDRVTIQMASGGGAKAAQEWNERAVGLPGGRTAYAPDAESARKLRDLSATTMSIQDKTDQLIKLTGSYTGKVIPGAVKDTVKQLITDLTLEYGRAKGQGAMGEEEYARMTSLFKDPSELFTSDSRAIEAARQFRMRSDAGFLRTLQANRMLQ